MKSLSVIAAACALVASPIAAEETRQLDAHEHGVGQLDIAIEGDKIAMELHAPGADIVGFEYAAKTDEDTAAIKGALETLSQPATLFVIPQLAGCSVTEANAELESASSHEEHEDQAKHAHEDHEGDHGEHTHDDEHDHDAHAEEGGHTEFHAEYLLTCTDISTATSLTFAYFDVFPNALEVEVQIITDSGARAFEVERDAPVLDFGSAL